MDSRTVFDLRKEAKELTGDSKLVILNEAYSISKDLYSLNPKDEWNQKAFAYTLIDLCKYCIAANNRIDAEGYYNQLLYVNFQQADNVIESQKIFLRPKIDVIYTDVKKAEELGKTGSHIDALNIFKKLVSENRLTSLHHEAYGWVIYRYIKDKEIELTSVEVRTLLKEYLNLQIEKPSMLHSTVLNFALQYSKIHNDFNLEKFFRLWDPVNLRSEDKTKQLYNGHDVPSLLSRIIRQIFDRDAVLDINYFVEKINLYTGTSNYTSSQRVLDLMREPYFWHLISLHKENKTPEIWVAFEKYNQLFSEYIQSKWHSEILSLAERFMQDSDTWRFLSFFRCWDPAKLLDEDWKEQSKDGNIYKPLAIKCLKKSYEILKNQSTDFEDSWLVGYFFKATQLFPKDEWVLREYALLLIKNKDLDLAIKLYRQLVLQLGNNAYIWHEFSSCFENEIDLRIGLLSKAIQIEKDEDFLGEIHLELAQLFFNKSLVENCVVELNTYKNHRNLKGWKLSESYNLILTKTDGAVTTLVDNKDTYKSYARVAEKYAYNEIDWTELVLIERWQTLEGKNKLRFHNGKSIDFSIGSKRFNELNTLKLGSVIKFKLYAEALKKEVAPTSFWEMKKVITEYKYIPLIVELSDKAKWSILDDTYVVFDYTNSERNIIHGITYNNYEVFFPATECKLQQGDFFKAKFFPKKIKDEIRLELREIVKIESITALSYFKKALVVIDSINIEKGLFHFVGEDKIQGIVKLTDSVIVPEVGKFLEVSYVLKKDRKNDKVVAKAITILESDQATTDLMRLFKGDLVLNYKAGHSETNPMGSIKNPPDFGFIGDYYVSKNVLIENSIIANCCVSATAVFNGEKWKVIKLCRI